MRLKTAQNIENIPKIDKRRIIILQFLWRFIGKKFGFERKKDFN
jgi:hypothetical protein